MTQLSNFFLGKVWPIAFGIGTGTGMAISNCQHEFRRMFSPISIVSSNQSIRNLRCDKFLGLLNQVSGPFDPI